MQCTHDQPIPLGWENNTRVPPIWCGPRISDRNPCSCWKVAFTLNFLSLYLESGLCRLFYICKKCEVLTRTNHSKLAVTHFKNCVACINDVCFLEISENVHGSRSRCQHGSKRQYTSWTSSRSVAGCVCTRTSFLHRACSWQSSPASRWR